MRLRFLLVFYIFGSFFSGFAQEPISESNGFVYNKYNFGFDFQNIASIIALPNGKINVSPYSNSNLLICNTNAANSFKGDNATSVMRNILFLKNEKYVYSEFNKVLPDNSLKEIFKVGSEESIEEAFLHREKIYMILSNGKTHSIDIKKFDGRNFCTVFSTKPSAIERNFIFHVGNEVYLFKSIKNKKISQLYQFNSENKPILIKEYAFAFYYATLMSPDEFYFEDAQNNLHYYRNGITTKINTTKNNNFAQSYKGGIFNGFDANTVFVLKLNKGKIDTLANINNASMSFNSLYNKESNSFYVGTGTNFHRVFPYLKKFPKVFNKSNSQQIFSIVQGNDGKIWAGSYNGGISFIEKNRVIEAPLKNFMIQNGGKKFGNKILINTEAGKGILLFENEKKYRKINDTIISFYNYLSRDSVLYSGTATHGIMYAKWKDVVSGKKIDWKFAGSSEGNKLPNNICVAEDKFGNIWSSQRGFSIYQPQKGKAITLEKGKDVDFSCMAMFADSRKTLWIGGLDGNLYHYEGKNRDDISPKNLIKIRHPLFNCGKYITFIHQWKNFLILGATDKILLFDLEKWYREKKVSVRYLNAMETNFATMTEQNAVLTDFRDESIWFSTSDMLYQWNIKDWLKLPTFKVKPEIVFTKDSIENHIQENQLITFKPRENSFDLDIRYQTKDNMPRYLSASLVKENESPDFDEPNLTTHFKFQNLRSGNYIFYARICQQDGSFSIHKFNIKIERFLWQHWWFWFLMSLFPIFFIYYYFRNKKELEQRKKEIAQLNVATLSNQFRPHFMLNALNSLGTEMDEKPHAEKVISRIGENINLMYDYSQERNFYIPFKKEWKLVENTIEIQKIIFIKDLEVSVKNKEIIPENYLLPMGILQIVVENALLHGIRHRKNPPCLLEINFSENKDYYLIEVIDNGVGRENSAKIYDFKRKGSGLKNIFGLIKIINSEIPDAIIIKTENISQDENYPGTKVSIQLKKNIPYEKFKF